MKKQSTIERLIRTAALSLLAGCCSATVSAQSRLLDELKSQGFENLTSGTTPTSVWFTFEDRVHRNTWQGIADAVQGLIDDRTITQNTELIVLDDGVPQVKVVVPYELISDCREGVISVGDVYRKLTVTHNTDDYRKGQAKGEVYNASAGKPDLVFYPQVMLAGYLPYKLYAVAVELAPALEMPLWKGARLTGQVIFPIYNNLQGEVDYIRPGIIALSQSFKLRNNVYGRISAGNFNANRMGVDVSLAYTTHEGRFRVGVDAGLTGSSTFYDGRWQVSTWSRFNGFVVGSYYEPRYNLQFDLSLGQYLYGDQGGRLDCTRHFGEVAVGVFAMYSGRVANGGFHFAIPLPGRNRKRSKSFPVRFMLPERFDWEYQAQTTREYMERRLGQIYEIRPDENRSSRNFNPAYIQSNLKKIMY